MSAESENVPKVKVGNDLYVNEATIELLQRRIESQVLSNFIKMIGIPVTGGGIIAILIAALYWIPSQVGKVVEENPTIKAQIAAAVEKYLGEGRGQEFLARETESSLRRELPEVIDRHLSSTEIAAQVSQQLPKSVDSYFTKGDGDAVLKQQLLPVVSDYLSRESGQNLLTSQISKHLQSTETAALLKAEVGKGIPKGVETYLAQGAGKQELERAVQGQIDDEKMKQIIRQAVNDILRNNAVSRASSIDANRSKAVTAIATPKVQKGSSQTLQQFLAEEETQKAGEAGRPLAIGFTVGTKYVSSVIDDYVKETLARYPRSEVYILLNERDGSCLALCGPVVRNGEEVTRLKESAGRDKFIEAVQSGRGDRFLGKLDEFREILGTVVTSQLKVSDSLESALRSPAWKNPDDVHEQVAVVNFDREFVGTTTREMLLNALLK
jgi:hypothetical protein